MARLSKRADQILRKMYEADVAEEYEDAEIAEDRGVPWLGDERISPATLKQLQRYVLISETETSPGFRRHTINDTGRDYVRRGRVVLEEVLFATITDTPIHASLPAAGDE